MIQIAARLRSPSTQLVLGSVVAQFVLFAVAPVITRLFSPSEFAVLSIYTAVVSLFTAFVVLRFDVALFTIAVHRLPAVLRSAAIVSAVLSIAVAALFFFVGMVHDFRLVGTGLAGFSALVALGLWCSSVYSTVSSAAVSKGEYRATTTTRVVQAVAGGLVQIAAGWLGASSPGLILGYLVSQSFGISRLWRLIGRDLERPSASTQLATIRNLCTNEFRGFALYSAPASVLNRLSGNLSVLLFAVIYDLHASGLFALALRSTSAPLLAVGRGIAQTFQKQFSQNTSKSQRQVVVSTIRMMFALGAIPCVILLFVGPPLFRLVFGPNWTEAGRYAAILSPSLLLQFVAFPIAQSFSLGRQFRRQLAWDTTRALLIIGLFASLYLLRVNELYGVCAISAVLSLVYGSQIAMAVSSANPELATAKSEPNEEALR